MRRSGNCGWPASIARGWLAMLVLAGLAVTAAPAADRPRRSLGKVSRAYYEARSLFEKVWGHKGDEAEGGDGLGPLFNARSCVACHHQGGTGGGGPNDRNVFVANAVQVPEPERDVGFEGELSALHPAFEGRRSILLHRFATSRKDADELAAIHRVRLVKSSEGWFELSRAERSTPALFGSGLIDAIPDAVLVEASRRVFVDFPEVHGRLSVLPDGRLGRFGWKGQTATLREFVLAACANELGLDVPGHRQPTLHVKDDPDQKPGRLDLSADQCDGLLAFVARLPAPALRLAEDGSPPLPGRKVFDALGCATCHAPALGRVEGIYSDLLLHDLGDRFRDTGSSYGSTATTGQVVDRAHGGAADSGRGEAGPTEWRTPPLWGVADSAPYLHDGRARTLHDAILLHGGEADKTAKRYEKLGLPEKRSLMHFLCSLVAPSQPRLSDYSVKGSRAELIRNGTEPPSRPQRVGLIEVFEARPRPEPELARFSYGCCLGIR